MSKEYQLIYKIILIGDTGTGKTSIINRYVHKVFETKYMCTIGVDFMMKKVLINGNEVKLQIWDTAGMEKYRQITTSYYRGAQGAIVVFDLTSKSSFDSVKKWIDDFCSISCPSADNGKTIIVVGNKNDLHDLRAVSDEEINKFISMNNFSYFETSAKTGDGVETIFDVFVNKFYQEHLRLNHVKKRKFFMLSKGNSLSTDGFEDEKKGSVEEGSCC